MFTVQPNAVDTDGNPNIAVNWFAPTGQHWSGPCSYSTGLVVYTNTSGFYASPINSDITINNNELTGKFTLSTSLVAGNYLLYVGFNAIVDASGNQARALYFPFSHT